MMKRMLSAFLLLGSLLSAETFENLTWEFPPSNFEWKLFMDETSIKNMFSAQDTEDQDFAEEIAADLDESFPSDTPAKVEITRSTDSASVMDQIHFRMFFHREGDALEIFTVQQLLSDGDDDEDDEMDTLETAQLAINGVFEKFFPNHKIHLLSGTENGKEGFCDWELTDGTQDLMHGYAKGIEHTDGKKITILSYMTTALRTEHNQMLWTNLLNQIKIED